MNKTGPSEGIPARPFTIFPSSKVDSITGLVARINNLKHDNYENIIHNKYDSTTTQLS
jgi:hypothetical protein